MKLYVPKRPLVATFKFNLKKKLEPLLFWFEDASTFYTWEVGVRRIIQPCNDLLSEFFICEGGELV
jgi:hypothetical protein